MVIKGIEIRVFSTLYNPLKPQIFFLGFFAKFWLGPGVLCKDRVWGGGVHLVWPSLILGLVWPSLILGVFYEISVEHLANQNFQYYSTLLDVLSLLFLYFPTCGEHKACSPTPHPLATLPPSQQSFLSRNECYCCLLWAGAKHWFFRCSLF